MSDSCADADVLTREQMRLVLQLAVALWGDLPTDCDPGRLTRLHQNILLWVSNLETRTGRETHIVVVM